MGASYLKALQLQKKLEEKAKKEAENRKKAEEELGALEGLLVEYEKADLDISEAREYHKKVKELMSAKEYGDALGEMKKLREALEKAKVAQLDDMISASEEVIELSRNMGANTEKAERLLKETKEALEKEAPLGDLVKKVRSAWSEAERVLQERISGAFSEAQSLMVKLKEMGEDVSTAEELFQEAREASDAGDYKKALDKLGESVNCWLPRWPTGSGP
ncbi:MAG: hypothetical protein J7L61_00690 [Thermoplasmata archaeon]|nr:hypothetical protein [Thermoplasmata archaeon]